MKSNVALCYYSYKDMGNMNKGVKVDVGGSPCCLVFVYLVSNLLSIQNRDSKSINAKFIYISRNLSSHSFGNNMRWLGVNLY